MTISDNFRKLSDSVMETALSCGRKPEDIKIISVSKTFPWQDVQEAIRSGITLFGENKVQEARLKIPMLEGNFDFHMIGHLQSNKARDAVKLFSLIHSIDKISTAEKVNAEAQKNGSRQRILLQLKTADEDTKTGASEKEILSAAERVLELPNVILEGIMTVGPLTADTSLIRRSFRQTAEVLEKINSQFSINLKEISMGMSDDYRTAIEEGSTMIRVGSAIFGRREYK